MYRLLERGEVIESGDEWYNEERGWYKAGCVGSQLLIGTPMRRLVKHAVTPASSTPDPGYGWRLIDKVVDKPEKGDEIWDTNQWKHRGEWFDGKAYNKNNVYRRKLPAVPAVDPGEGYRLLREGETIEKGDEYYSVFSRAWIESCSYLSGVSFVKPANNTIGGYRRRVEKPAPVVSVGDRVKVLTGPWAGCTGVVTGFEVEVSLSGYGKMTALRDSVPVVLLDHVYVGGSQLSVVASVEKLPPVVPEVLYRDLSHGETTRLSDEMLHPYSHVWHPCHGIWTVDSIRVRRPVRMQSPGWRYLDAGETVQAGDETAFLLGVPWRAAADYFNLPYVVRNKNIPSVNFRRKLPTISGG